MIKLTGLEQEQHKKIGQLSKGYKQRVGLAQALIHDPKVLILDEHTSGLDPNQLSEIRALIKKISKDKVVIFSSHFMQEVEGLCDRVVVINKGKIVANDMLTNLIAKYSPDNQYKVTFGKKLNKADFTSLGRAIKVRRLSDYGWIMTGDKGVDVPSIVLEKALAQGWNLKEIQRDTIKFEEIFNKLTK